MVHFMGALESGPFSVSEFSVHEKGDCQIKNTFVFSHPRNGGCTCDVIAVDSTGI